MAAEEIPPVSAKWSGSGWTVSYDSASFLKQIRIDAASATPDQLPAIATAVESARGLSASRRAYLDHLAAERQRATETADAEIVDVD